MDDVVSQYIRIRGELVDIDIIPALVYMVVDQAGIGNAHGSGGGIVTVIQWVRLVYPG